MEWGEVNDLEKQKKRILKSMEAQSEKFFFISFVFWFCFHSVWCSPSVMSFSKNVDAVLYGLFWSWTLILVVFGMFCSVWVWVGRLGKNWPRIWALTCGRKGRFDCYMFYLIVCVRKFFSLDCVGFRRCNVYCNLCMRWRICLCERWFRCWSILWCLWVF